MRAAMIDLLELPRRVVLGQVEFETCQHAGLFAPDVPECNVCETRLECEWLCHNDQPTALAEKPFDELREALGSAILFIDACVERNGHERGACACELCAWLARANELLVAASRA